MSNIKNINDTNKVNKIYPEILENNNNIAIEVDYLVQSLARSNVDTDTKELIRNALDNITNSIHSSNDLIYDDCEQKLSRTKQ